MEAQENCGNNETDIIGCTVKTVLLKTKDIEMKKCGQGSKGKIDMVLSVFNRENTDGNGY